MANTEQRLSTASKLANAPSGGRIDQFTRTLHSQPPEHLLAKNATLPAGFSICIIGASRGIGEHIAYCYAEAGVESIMLAARSTDALEIVADKVRDVNPKCKVFTVGCDVASPTSVIDLVGSIKSNVGRLDAVVYNSGYSGDVILDVTKTPEESFRIATEVNLLGTFHAAHEFIPLLTESKDGAKQFLVVGTLAAAIVKGPIANAQYCVTKAAQMRLVEHIHEQYGDQGLFTLCMHPGAVITDMSSRSAGAEEFLKEFCKDSPALCGSVCVWLSSNPTCQTWLGGRLISANWDMQQLEQRREEIVQRDLLKFKIAA